MLKNTIISTYCIIISSILGITIAFAEESIACQSNSYCITVDVTNSKRADNLKNDLCFVLQINASDRLTSGSIPIQQLPAVLFSIPNNGVSLGKPLHFKILKAHI